jgi:hypothetical protein
MNRYKILDGDNSSMDQAAALIHFHLKENPDNLTNEQFAIYYNRVHFCIRKENEKWQKG